MQPPLHFYAGVREATVTRVLVVDDEPKLRRALEANLRIRGYEVDLAGTGEAALSLAQRQGFEPEGLLRGALLRDGAFVGVHTLARVRPAPQAIEEEIR